MRIHIPPFVALVVACSVFAGCVSRSYVDPSIPKVSYEDIQKRNEPLRLRVTVEYQRNGRPSPGDEPSVKGFLERVLQRTGLVAPADEGGEGEFRVVVNNTAAINVGDAIGAGLTMGLAGTTFTDEFEMSVTITAQGKTVSRTGTRHVLHTAYGQTPIPAGAETAAPGVATGQVLEQLLLRVLRDMQKNGELTSLRGRVPLAFRTPAGG